MDISEVNSYKLKLEEVEIALATDPSNRELLNLKSEINDLLSLASALLGDQEASGERKGRAAGPTPSPGREAAGEKDESGSQAAGSSGAVGRAVCAESGLATGAAESLITDAAKYQTWNFGDDCYARYSQDGKFYPAKVTEVKPNKVFTVTFVGYGNSEEVSANYLLPISTSKAELSRVCSAFKKATETAVPSPATKNKIEMIQRKKDAKKPGSQKRKADSGPSDTVIRQKQWLEFAKNPKSFKRGRAPPINKKSIFRSPDTVEGRVGVIGSGRDMTQFVQRVKYR